MTKHKFKGPRPLAIPPVERIAYYLGTAGITEEQTKALRWLFVHEMRLLQQKEQKIKDLHGELLQSFVAGLVVMGIAVVVYHFFWVW